ncbi:MAG: hypothetical protein ACOCX9_06630 [Spirochaetota bacterium]
MAEFMPKKEWETMIFGFFEEMKKHDNIAGPLLDSNLVVRFRWMEPEFMTVIDFSGDKVDIRPLDEESKADVEMIQKAEVSHKFWFGKLNVVSAITRKQIISKGSVPKALKLLPVLKPAYTLYPQYLKDNGYQKYII